MEYHFQIINGLFVRTTYSKDGVTELSVSDNTYTKIISVEYQSVYLIIKYVILNHHTCEEVDITCDHGLQVKLAELINHINSPEYREIMGILKQ